MLRTRHFLAACIGGVLLGLASWFDVVWVWALAVLMIPLAFLLWEYVFAGWRPLRRRRLGLRD